MQFIFGQTRVLRDLEAKAAVLARSRGPILIVGETGTGKERLAAYLHQLRGSRGKLLKVMCDASGLAAAGMRAPVHAATNWRLLYEGGEDTVLLKRVHRLPLAAQEDLLLAMEQRAEDAPLAIATAAEPLERVAARGAFAAELLYRLSAYSITLPPLRERTADLPELWRELVAEVAAETGLPAPGISPEEMAELGAYRWPGNLRELENVARAFVLAPDGAKLAAAMRERSPGDGVLRANSSRVATLKEQVREASRRVESEIIMRTLEENRWNRRRTAQTLNISYRSLLYKMKNCKIQGQPTGAAGCS